MSPPNEQETPLMQGVPTQSRAFTFGIDVDPAEFKERTGNFLGNFAYGVFLRRDAVRAIERVVEPLGIRVSDLSFVATQPRITADGRSEVPASGTLQGPPSSMAAALSAVQELDLRA